MIVLKVEKNVLRTDFCDELIVKKHEDDSLSYTSYQKDNCKITHISILKEENTIKKDIGEYITIDFDNMYDAQNRKKISACIQECLHTLVDYRFDKVLVVGLGNKEAVSDALGPNTCEKILVTSHLFALKNQMDLDGCCNVSVLTPKVMGQTGMESAVVCKAVAAFFKPDLMIVIDALATSCIKRINGAIQMNTVGIKPGSGVGNHRKEISEKTMQCKVITLGVATVSSLHAIFHDVFKEDSNWMDCLKNEDALDMIVTPKNMDDDLHHLSSILADGINRFLHRDYDIF